MCSLVFFVFILNLVNSLDFRVTRGVGPNGYNNVRLSVITQEPTVFDYAFEIQHQFKQRWTDNYLYSTILELEPGLPRNITINGTTIPLYLPAQTEGVSGIMFADPCIGSIPIPCTFQRRWGPLKNRTAFLLNALMTDPTLDYWMILGDNFYDRDGHYNQDFFGRLTVDVKRRYFATVMGNHDTWGCGSPWCGHQKDQFGIGMMQFYGLDTLTSTYQPDHFLDFSNDPDVLQQWNTSMTVPSNLIWYHILGNIGFLGWSSAYAWTDYAQYFEDACMYFFEERVDYIFLIAHWHKDSDGAQNNMSAPSVYHHLRTMPGCMEYGDRLKYQEGHEHCNEVREEGEQEAVGFMIGASGMMDFGFNCGPQYGFEYIKTTAEGDMYVYYFELSHWRGDQYDEIVQCILDNKSMDACLHYATVWLDTTTTKKQIHSESDPMK